MFLILTNNINMRQALILSPKTFIKGLRNTTSVYLKEKTNQEKNISELIPLKLQSRKSPGPPLNIKHELHFLILSYQEG